MRIGLYGYTDKRPVLYSLLSILQATGDVAVITSNRHLKRLIPDHTDLGYFGNILICVTDWTPDEVWDAISHRPEDFSHVIYDMTDSVAEVDFNIHVLGSEYEDDEEEFLEMLHDLTKIKLMYDGKQAGKDSLSVPISADYLSVVEKIERNKVYSAFNNKQLNTAIAKVLAPRLKLPESTVLKMFDQVMKRR